jgi:hypothetical protein
MSAYQIERLRAALERIARGDDDYPVARARAALHALAPQEPAAPDQCPKCKVFLDADGVQWHDRDCPDYGKPPAEPCRHNQQASIDFLGRELTGCLLCRALSWDEGRSWIPYPFPAPCLRHAQRLEADRVRREKAILEEGMTKTQTIIELLLDSGFTEVTAQHRTRKYRVFQDPNCDRHPVYVGKSAGVRRGRTISESVSVDADRLIAVLELKLKMSKEL